MGSWRLRSGSLETESETGICIQVISDQFSSVTQLCLTLQPQGRQHARPPCASPTPRACSNSCPSSRWCHPTISSSVIPFSSHLQPFPASVSFPMNQLFTSGGIKWFLNFLKDEQISLLKKMFLQRKRQGIFFDQFIVKHKTFPQYKHNTRHSLLIEEDFH